MGERVNQAVEKTKQNAKRFGALAAIIGGSALFAAGCGSSGGGMPKKEAESYAMKDYNLTWDKATSPVAKYIMQYIAVTQVDILDKNGGGGSEGKNLYHHFVFGNGCLQNTAYDIAGGRIYGSFNGLFAGGNINGRVPTAAADAYVNASKPNVLTVESGHANSHDLHFSGVNDGSDYLTPLGQATNDVLATYGCVPAGSPQYSVEEAFSGDTSGFIIRTLGDQARPSRPDPSN